MAVPRKGLTVPQWLGSRVTSAMIPLRFVIEDGELRYVTDGGGEPLVSDDGEAKLQSDASAATAMKTTRLADGTLYGY